MTLKDTAQGLINKVEQALDNKKSTSSTTHGTTSTTTTGTNLNQANNPASTNHGPHSSNLANKTDPRIDSDLDGRQTTYAQGNNNNTLGSSTGPGYSDTSNTAFNNSQSTNAGPHSSNLVNKLDPRVDSDRDGRNDPTSRTGGYGNNQTEGSYSNYPTAPATVGGSSAFNSNQSTSAGPHSSNVMNKLDPRVDSDRDGRNDPTSRIGGYGDQQTTSTYGNTGHTTSTTGATSTLGNNPQSTTAGPHSSNVMNKLDPRVDSDRDGRNDPTSHVGGYGNTQHNNPNTYGGTTHSTSATTGGTSTLGSNQSTNAGPHDSNLLNKLDPRVDSDRDGRYDSSLRAGETQPGNTYSGTNAYPGTTMTPTGGASTLGGNNLGGNTFGSNNPQSTNAGPHGSNLMNKLDPRVDSDRDGAGTRGVNY